MHRPHCEQWCARGGRKVLHLLQIRRACSSSASIPGSRVPSSMPRFGSVAHARMYAVIISPAAAQKASAICPAARVSLQRGRITWCRHTALVAKSMARTICSASPQAASPLSAILQPATNSRHILPCPARDPQHQGPGPASELHRCGNGSMGTSRFGNISTLPTAGVPHPRSSPQEEETRCPYLLSRLDVCA